MKTLLIPITLMMFFKLSLFAEDISIEKYGAVGDGITLNTEAIQKTIDAVHQSGEGRVIVPRGKFLTGSINLLSGVELHLEEGAILLGSTLFEHHQVVEKHYQRAIIMSSYQENISITGEGTIDGQGREAAIKTDSLFKIGELPPNRYNHVEKRPRFYMRPMLIVFLGCKNVNVQDVTLKNSASWVQHYDRCTNVTITGITVDSDAYWNNDGIDISDSKQVTVNNCIINSADDGICLKSHYDDQLLENVVVENCIVRSSASAIKFGTKSLGGFKNVAIKNIRVYDTFRSAIAIESVDGGTLENVTVDQIHAVNTGNAIFIKIGHREENKEVATLKNVTVSNLYCEVAFERPDYKYQIRGPALPFFHNTFPSSITGMPDHYVKNVTLENIEIKYPGKANKGLAYAPLSRLDSIPENANDYPEFSMFGELPAWGFYMRHVDNIKLKNIKLSIEDNDYRVPFVLDDVLNAQFDNVEISGDVKGTQVILNKSEGFSTSDDLKVVNLKR